MSDIEELLRTLPVFVSDGLHHIQYNEECGKWMVVEFEEHGNGEDTPENVKMYCSVSDAIKAFTKLSFG